MTQNDRGKRERVNILVVDRGDGPRERNEGVFAVVLQGSHACFCLLWLLDFRARRRFAAQLAERYKSLLASLRTEFPRAELVCDRAVWKLTALDLIGTPFQMRVWRALLSIPRGETTTYGELAKKLGTAPRAVARACASNRVALLVPCHRVIGGNGALPGYRWGLERKEAILRGERADKM